MTPEQIEKTSQLHADLHFVDEAEKLLNMPWNKAKDRYAKNLADFAKYCVSHQWVSVGERLPELGERVLICEKVANQYKIFIGKRVSFYDSWEWNQSKKENVVAWMPLPKYSPEKIAYDN